MGSSAGTFKHALPVLTSFLVDQLLEHVDSASSRTKNLIICVKYALKLDSCNTSAAGAAGPSSDRHRCQD